MTRENSHHHILRDERHPVLRSIGFNLIFLSLLVGLLILFNNVFGDGRLLEKKEETANIVAGVGALTSYEGENGRSINSVPGVNLPFSDEVIVSSGSNGNSVVVRPVFRTGPGKKSYEYQIVAVPHD